MTKLELQQLLKSMDHYTQYSDDYSVVEHGRKQRDFILDNNASITVIRSNANPNT